MGEGYLWVKVLHVLAVISWMAGLFYLPRLFVYHAENMGNTQLTGTFKLMERRLLKAIMRPAGLVSVLTGLWLIWLGSWYGPVPAWLWLKLLFVLAMLGVHGMLEMHAGRFRDGRETKPGRYFRIINEIPTVLLIGIVIFVIVKPF
jgi:putative membrane protein